MGLGMTNMSLESMARASWRTGPPAAPRVPLDNRFAVDLRALHVVVARNEVDHLRARCLASCSIISLSLSTLRLLQISLPAHAARVAKLHDALQMLLAAYMAIISPEHTM